MSGPPDPGYEPPPTDDGDNNTGGTNTGGGTTSTGGSSSGGSSSGSSAPAEPQDPYDAWYEKIGTIDKKRVSVFDQLYQQLWGEPAPLAVLQAAVNQGLNRWEFEEAQKRNPAWWKTDAAEEETFPAKLFLYQMGLIPKPKRRKGGGKKDDGGKPNQPPGGGDPGPIIKPDKDKGRPGYLGPPDREKDEGREIGVIRG
jgi:hypothetical protein